MPFHSQISTGKGALAQLGYETGLRGMMIDSLIIALIGFNLAVALLPTAQTFAPGKPGEYFRYQRLRKGAGWQRNS